MRIRLVKTLKGGERLAEPVITEEKETLISAGTILKPEYLDLISFLGIEAVCIDDPFEAEEIPHEIIDKEKQKEYVARVQKILENHIYQGKNSLEKLKPLAEDIVKDLVNADDTIVIDMRERNGNLYEHTIMVTLLAVIVAKRMKVKEEDLYTIALGCLLHDLGLRYITVPYINCDMESRPASENFEFKKHTILAYSALENEDWIDATAKRMILSHHERKDGSGFPLKQKVRDLGCNILQTCDAFDCSISGMEMKRVSIQQTLEYLVEASDILFERKIVKVLEKLIARYPVGTRVRLTSGETGVVISQTENSIRPVIGVLDESEHLTEVRYHLDKNKKISILEVES